MAIGRPSEGEKPPEVTRPTITPLRVGDFRSIPRRRLAVKRQSNPHAGNALRQLALHARRARKTALFATAFGNRPVQGRLDRAGGLVEFVTIEAKSGFEPQGIAGAEADGADLLLGQQRRGEIVGESRRDRDFEPVLARIAGTRDKQRRATPGEFLQGHEDHLRDAGEMALQHARRARPLQGEKGAIFQNFKPQVGQFFAQQLEIRSLAGGVDHQEKLFAGGVEPGHHQVVENAAVFIGELGVARAPGRQSANIAGDEAFEFSRRVRSRQESLAHVRHIEQAGVLAREKMLGDNAAAVIHRQFIAGERRHAAAQRDMAGVKRRPGRRR